MNTNSVISKADVEYIHDWFFNTFKESFMGLAKGYLLHDNIERVFEKYSLSFRMVSKVAKIAIKVNNVTIFEYTCKSMEDFFILCDKLDDLVGTELEYVTDDEEEDVSDDEEEDDGDEEEEDDDDEEEEDDDEDSCSLCVKGWSKANEWGRCKCVCWCLKLVRNCKYACDEFKKHCDGFKKADA